MRRLLAYLSAHPCVDCFEVDPLVLDFDHRDAAAKRINVSDMLDDYSWQRIEAEISKCDVRCANCHRRRTAHQFKWRRLTLAQPTPNQGAGAAGLEPATCRFGDDRSTN